MATSRGSAEMSPKNGSASIGAVTTAASGSGRADCSRARWRSAPATVAASTAPRTVTWPSRAYAARASLRSIGPVYLDRRGQG